MVAYPCEHAGAHIDSRPLPCDNKNWRASTKHHCIVVERQSTSTARRKQVSLSALNFPLRAVAIDAIPQCTGTILPKHRPSWSHEQTLCCSCHLFTAHGALSEPLRFLALLTHHMSAWHQCDCRSGFVANWTGAAGAGWSSPSLLWSLGFQIPLGITFDPPTTVVFLLDITYNELAKAEFTNSLLQSLQISIRPPLWTSVVLFTKTAPLGCLGFTCFHEAPEDFLPKLFLDALGFPSQALCKGHEQQRCHGSCLSLLCCFNLQRLKGGRVVTCQTRIN